jgi:hypothetical protein
MRGFSILLLVLGLAPASAQAASTATLRLTAIIPVSCAVDLVGAQVGDHKLVLDVRRECNTAHNIIVAGQRDAALGEITMRYNDVELTMQSDSESIPQTENYYDGVDHIVIDVTGGTTEDLQRYAQSLNIALDTV